MNKKTNIIFSILATVISLAIAVTFIILKNYYVGIGFVVASVVFVCVFAKNFRNEKLYVNRHNLLPLKTDSSETSPDHEAIKARIRRNLTANRYKLDGNFYVNTTNKQYDVYFSTYTKSNLRDKLSQLCARFEKDADALIGMVEAGGFMETPVDVGNLTARIFGSAHHYNNPDMFSHQRRRYYIFVGLDEPKPKPKPTFTFWVLPYNDPQSVDHVTFVDVSATDKFARLDTTSTKRAPELREEIRKIFKGVLDFDGEFTPERVRELNLHD